MRVFLKEGKQKELILLAKNNLLWIELAKKLNINHLYLSNDIKNERTSLTEKAYKELCKIAEVNYDKYIVKKLNENWGQSKGGNSSPGNTKEIKIPRYCKEFAEFYGIMLGDGNLTVKKGYKIATYQIRIVGDSRKDRDYLLNYVKPLIENLFSIKVKISKQKNTNALYLTSTGRKLAEFLEKEGFKPGDKIRNHLEIPEWIKQNPLFLGRCLRGLYDTDGSAYQLTNQNSYQICLTSYNQLLLNQVRGSLLQFQINPSKITKNRDLLITKKSELRKFLNEVGFSNNKHLDKIKMWNI